VSYLQPAELRPSLLEVIATTPGVAPYFDLSFQHASPAVLRRMQRFGSTEAFVELLERARGFAPELGARSNVIVGFPGETETDLAELERFLSMARLDAIGVFGYSDEEGTAAADFGDKLDADEVSARVERVAALADELVHAARRGTGRRRGRHPGRGVSATRSAGGRPIRGRTSTGSLGSSRRATCAVATS